MGEKDTSFYLLYISALLRYHNRATLVVSALQVEKHPIVTDIVQQLHLSEISPKKDGDTDTVTSICADSKSIGISSPFKVNRYGENNSRFV